MRASAGWSLLVALAVTACAPPQTPPPPRPATELVPACRDAAAQRARVPQLVAEGKLDRTVRVIHDADLRCPGSARETRLALLHALLDLSRTEAAEEVARDILQTPGTPRRDLDDALGVLQSIVEEKARGTPARPPLEVATELFARAQGARGTPEARRLLDRAVSVLERDRGPLALDVKWPGYGGAAWLPDGRLVVSMGEKQSRIVRVDTGETTPLAAPAYLLAPDEPLEPPVLSPDARFVIVDAARREPGLYRSDTGAEVRALDTEAHRVRWSPDSRWLAWAKGAEVMLLDLPSNDRRELEPPPSKLGVEAVASIAVGDHAVVALTRGGHLHFWELPSRRYVGMAQGLASKSAGPPEEARRLAMSADGTVVAAWLDGPAKHAEVGLFDTATGKLVTPLRDTRCTPAAFAMHPSKPELAMGAAGVICFWDTASRRLARVMRPDVMRALDVTFAGPNAPSPAKAALSTSPRTVQLLATLPFESIHYEGKEPEIALAVPYMLGTTRFDDRGAPDVSPLDPRVVATADGPVVSGSAHALSGIRSREFIGRAERWEDLAVSPDGKYVVERAGAGRVWDAASGRVVRRFAEHAGDEVLVWTSAGLTRQRDAPGSAATPVRSPGGEYEAVLRAPHGEIEVTRVADGSHRATLYPLPDDDGAVIQDDQGRVELLPDDARTRALLLCHVRDVVLPAEACEERLVTNGLWSAMLEEGARSQAVAPIREPP
jgi:hypothetical protein